MTQLVLNSGSVQAQLSLTPVLSLNYLGAPLQHPVPSALQETAVPQAQWDEPVVVPLLHTAASGVFGGDAIRLHRHGRHWSPNFEVTTHEQSAENIRIECVDTELNIRAELSLSSVADSGVFALQISLVNDGDDVQLDQCLLTLPLADSWQQVTRFTGHWTQEFQPQSHPIYFGDQGWVNNRGRTSHDHFPGLVLSRDDAHDLYGDHLIAHLAWSGNHQTRLVRNQQGVQFLQIGEYLSSGEILLNRGDRYDSPVLYFSHSSNGLNGLRQQMHKAARDLVDWPNGETRPVLVNTWEALYFDHRPEPMSALMDAAKTVGVERFVLDDGWFPERRHDHAGLGDWAIDEAAYPDGFKPLVSALQSRGLSFGLWFEPEMVNEDSELYRQHPDWLLELDHSQQRVGRHQYVLNITRSDVSQYLISKIDALLSDYPIEYIKWDMNRDLFEAADAQGRPLYHRYVQALYRIIDVLRDRHPSLDIESCASGGGRMDWAMLQRVQRFWTSDCNDALTRHHMHRWASLFFPPEVLGVHIGPPTAHTTGRTHSDDFRFWTTLLGQVGIEWNIAQAPQESQQSLTDFLTFYRNNRDWIARAEQQFLPMDDGRQVMLYRTPERVLVMCTQLSRSVAAVPKRLLLSGLSAQRGYRITPVYQPSTLHLTMKNTLTWLTGHDLFLGEQLTLLGLPMPVLPPESMLVFDLVEDNA